MPKPTKSKAYTCRMTGYNSSLIEEAVSTTGHTRAEILRKAFRYYVSVNPDEIATFGGAVAEDGVKNQTNQTRTAIGSLSTPSEDHSMDSRPITGQERNVQREESNNAPNIYDPSFEF